MTGTRPLSLEIITVVRAPSAALDMTLESVLQLNAKRLSVGWTLIYLGMDKTIVETMKTASHHLGPRFQAFEQAQTGIYAAMNEGMVRNRGEFFCFINSGDMLLTSVAEVLGKLNPNKVSFFMNAFHDEEGEVLPSPNRSNLNLPILGLMPSHQAMIFPKVFRTLFYDTRFPVSADQDLKLFLSAMGLLERESGTIASSLRPGISAQRLSPKGVRERTLESFLVFRKHFSAVWAFALAGLYGLRFTARLSLETKGLPGRGS